MNVLLIQPNEPAPTVENCPLSDGYTRSYSVNWNLLCLEAYLKGRTRHHCHIVDFRVTNDPDQALEEELTHLLTPGIIVVYCEATNLGSARTLLSNTRKKAPHITTAICGPFPTAFPLQARELELADYYISGDPEPVLRNLLDFVDIPQRLRNTPGLQIPHQTIKPPYWLDNLQTLSLPAWSDVFWTAYQQSGSVRVNARLARGVPPDTFNNTEDVSSEPFREWPLQRMASSFQKSSRVGISQVQFSDQPDFWTPARINRWCTTLRNSHNTQNWSLQLNPISLPVELIDNLDQACCNQVDFILPSAHPDIAAQHGIHFDAQKLRQTVKELNTHGIQAYVRIRIGGPNTTPDEIEYALQTAKFFDITHTVLEPYPFRLESVAPSDENDTRIKSLRDLTKWIEEPWTADKPTLFWGGEAGVLNTQRGIAHIHKTLTRNARRFIANCWRKVSTIHFIHYLEDKALGLLVKYGPNTPPQ